MPPPPWPFGPPRPHEDHAHHPPLPHHHHPPHHRESPDHRVIDALRNLIATGHVRTLADLIARAAEIDPRGERAKVLASLDGTLPPGLALAKLALQEREQIYLREQALVAAAGEGPVVLIPPVPPRFYDCCIGAEVVVACVDEHLPPPHILYGSGVRVLHDRFEAADTVARAVAVVFDAFAWDTHHVRRAVAELLGNGRLAPTAKLFGHLRPRPDERRDVPLAPDLSARLIEV